MVTVVHLTPATFGRGRRGGGERYFNEYVRALSSWDIEQWCYSIPKLWSVNYIDQDVFVERDSSVGELWSSLKKADLVHIHQLNTPGFDLAMTARLFRPGLKVVLSDHGGGRITPGRALGKYRLRFVDGLAMVSEWSYRDVDPEGVVQEVEIVYGGGDHVLHAVAPKGDIPPSDFLYVGRLLPHKGAHIAIQALPPGACLTIAGETRSQEYLDYLTELATGKDVRFVGSPDDSDLPGYYRSSKYLVLPSVEQFGTHTYKRPELLGLVVLESLACGTPVIGSNTGGLSEVLSIAGQYRAHPGDVEDWRQAMERALAEMVNVSETPFTWRNVAQKTVSLYDRVLASA